jgi:hypothetical protein
MGWFETSVTTISFLCEKVYGQIPMPILHPTLTCSLTVLVRRRFGCMTPAGGDQIYFIVKLPC